MLSEHSSGPIFVTVNFPATTLPPSIGQYCYTHKSTYIYYYAWVAKEQIQHKLHLQNENKNYDKIKDKNQQVDSSSNYYLRRKHYAYVFIGYLLIYQSAGSRDKNFVTNYAQSASDLRSIQYLHSTLISKQLKWVFLRIFS